MRKIADMLTHESVSILIINEDGTKHRCAYINSASGRKSLISNEPEEIVEKVFEVWGDKPIIEEPTYNDDTEQKRPKDVWDEMAEAIKQGVNNV